MVDIYTPIPNTLNIANSEQLLRELKALKAKGIEEFVPSKRICCSLFEDTFFESYRELIDNLSQKSGLKLIYGPLIRFSTASEFTYISDKLRINDSRYVNFELSGRPRWSRPYLSQLKEFIKQTNTVPVIISVEKYAAVKKGYKTLYTLKELGCVFSVSLTSFYDKQYKKIINKLVKHRLIDLFITGTHPENIADSDIKVLFETVKENVGDKYFEIIKNNSRLILGDKPIVNY